MTDLKTDPALVRRLEEAARQHLTADEIRRQKVSFIMSTLDDDSTITRAQVVACLDAMEGAV